jgi:hypothetical protein
LMSFTQRWGMESGFIGANFHHGNWSNGLVE